jgi:antitoxin ParD1/3/4
MIRFRPASTEMLSQKLNSKKFYVLIASAPLQTALSVKGFVLLIMTIREPSNLSESGRSFQKSAEVQPVRHPNINHCLEQNHGEDPDRSQRAKIIFGILHNHQQPEVQKTSELQLEQSHDCRKVMPQLTISLPEAAKAYIDEQVANGHYSSADMLLADLIEQAQLHQAQVQVNQLLRSTIQQNQTVEATDEWWDGQREQLRQSLSPE